MYVGFKARRKTTFQKFSGMVGNFSKEISRSSLALNEMVNNMKK